VEQLSTTVLQQFQRQQGVPVHQELPQVDQTLLVNAQIIIQLILQLVVVQALAHVMQAKVHLMDAIVLVLDLMALMENVNVQVVFNIPVQVVVVQVLAHVPQVKDHLITAIAMAADIQELMASVNVQVVSILIVPADALQLSTVQLGQVHQHQIIASVTAVQQL